MAKNLMSVFGAQSGKASSGETTDAEAAKGATATPAPHSETGGLPVMVLGKTLVFKGELSADEDMLLFGRVEGSIEHSSSLTVGIGGVVIGDIRARAITIKGSVEGDLEATESITIAPSANVEGDIAAPRVCIVEGAQFNGSVEMTEAPAREATAPARESAAVGADPNAVLSDKTVGTILGEK
jgi:cytoskeletal protein CcmA (bactofilin family)